MQRAKATVTKSSKAIGRPAVRAEINPKIRDLVLANAGTQREIAARLKLSRGAVCRRSGGVAKLSRSELKAELQSLSCGQPPPRHVRGAECALADRPLQGSCTRP
jgi:hypothetical protein